MPILNKFEKFKRNYPTYQSFIDGECQTLAHWYLYPLMLCRAMSGTRDEIINRYIKTRPELFQDSEITLGVVNMINDYVVVRLYVEDSNFDWGVETVDDDQLDEIVNEITKFDAIPFTLENVKESFDMLSGADIRNSVFAKTGENIETIINQIASQDNAQELLKINRFVNKYTCSDDKLEATSYENVNKQIDKALGLIENGEPLTIVCKNGDLEPNEIPLMNLTEPVIKTILKYKNFEPSIELSEDMIEHLVFDSKPMSEYMGILRRSLPAVKSINDIPEDAVVVETTATEVLQDIDNLTKPCDYLIVNGISGYVMSQLKERSNGMVKRSIFIRLIC